MPFTLSGAGNPAIHNRHSIRLQGYDYTQPGAYYVTINTFKKEHLFGKVVDGVVQLSEMGKIAQQQWCKIPNRFPNVTLDEFIIMPNHMHGIIIICDTPSVGAGFTPAQITHIDQTTQSTQTTQKTLNPYKHKSIESNKNKRDEIQFDSPDTGQTQKQGQSNENGQSRGLSLQRVSVGKIVGAYKSLVNNECLKIFKDKNEFMGKIWHRNYYEHIIRDKEGYSRIVEYIQQNPQKWEGGV